MSYKPSLCVFTILPGRCPIRMKFASTFVPSLISCLTGCFLAALFFLFCLFLPVCLSGCATWCSFSSLSSSPLKRDSTMLIPSAPKKKITHPMKSFIAGTGMRLPESFEPTPCAAQKSIYWRRSTKSFSTDEDHCVVGR